MRPSTETVLLSLSPPSPPELEPKVSFPGRRRVWRQTWSLDACCEVNVYPQRFSKQPPVKLIFTLCSIHCQGVYVYSEIYAIMSTFTFICCSLCFTKYTNFEVVVHKSANSNMYMTEFFHKTPCWSHCNSSIT